MLHHTSSLSPSFHACGEGASRVLKWGVFAVADILCATLR